MLTDFITKTDFTILNWIQEHMRSTIGDAFFPVFTFLGNAGWFFILMAVIFLLIPGYRKWGVSLATAFSIGFLFGNMIIKNAVERIRPYDVVDHITLLVHKLSDYSFPSGHTLAAFEAFAVVCFMPVKRIYKIVAGVFAMLMAFSRLYLYVHYPSDVLAGMLLGFLFGVMGVRIVTMIMEERNIDSDKMK